MSQNALVFNLLTHAATSVLQRSLIWVRYYNDLQQNHSTSLHLVECSSTWVCPTFGWICLNVDGAASSSTCMISIGDLIRDVEGGWILGFNKFLGVTSSFNVKLWAIYIGLQLAWDNGFEYVLLQFDCLKAIKLLQGHNMDRISISFVRAIDSLHQKCWVSEVTWVSRARNKPADSLAKRATSLHYAVSILEEPLDYLKPLLVGIFLLFFVNLS
ncbi:hypothetical protein V6N11_060337 [Hibiscus sabdariffa]|uniref:RNase H type-1 domain-containing protein n=1 Tax=Hibiscus sabdariffa TaxID=183260 RepID=A0ABR2QQ09_9ROSI